MGTVYLAEDKDRENHTCVIKQLTNKYDNPQKHAEAVRLFQREARILSQLNHPGIVRVFDSYASDDGRYFLVMDYVPGKNLDVMVRTGGPFTSDHATWIAIQCCEILEYLHSLTPPIIYRDLKPSNLMLTPEGKVVFIDFGIARTFMPEEAATRVITAGYSPPEQYFGKPEIRSDIYSLGATISHLVTGIRPKPLASVSPRLVDPKADEQLDDLIKQMTQHNPIHRPDSAKAVKFALYKIYKKYNPDFRFPDEDLANQVNEPKPTETSKHRAFARLSTKVVEAEGFADQLKIRGILEGIATMTATVWQRIRQCFGDGQD